MTEPPPPEARWKHVYTRTYDLRAPVEFARRWFLDRGIGPLPTPIAAHVRQSSERTGPTSARVRLQFDDGRMRTDDWEFGSPEEIQITKRLEEGGRTILWNRETYRFTREGSFTRLAVSVLRCAVGLRARLALAMSLRSPVRPAADERALCEEIDRNYRLSPSPAAPAA
ncbi:MAG: hypothetical protein L3K04_01050 [Thermoplasmata archaeon]|nr:hypothetical protein [Thermoplasmata archaeon]MCI4338472.1 hypothetical protein [Thermoplasmata archaeon]MCI4340796.1 hypothetical protein [Thermoplasmata archaeon]